MAIMGIPKIDNFVVIIISYPDSKPEPGTTCRGYDLTCIHAGFITKYLGDNKGF